MAAIEAAEDERRTSCLPLRRRRGLRRRGQAFAAAIKAAGVKGLSLAGRPRDAEAGLRAAGVDEFIFAGGDAAASLQGLYRRLGA